MEHVASSGSGLQFYAKGPR